MVKRCLITLRVKHVGSPNACDQSAFCAFHTFLVEIQTNAGYIWHMRNNNLDIRIAGSSCHPQLLCKVFVCSSPESRIKSSWLLRLDSWFSIPARLMKPERPLFTVDYKGFCFECNLLSTLPTWLLRESDNVSSSFSNLLTSLTSKKSFYCIK